MTTATVFDHAATHGRVQQFLLQCVTETLPLGASFTAAVSCCCQSISSETQQRRVCEQEGDEKRVLHSHRGVLSAVPLALFEKMNAAANATIETEVIYYDTRNLPGFPWSNTERPIAVSFTSPPPFIDNKLIATDFAIL